jgi:hypothetical protein
VEISNNEIYDAWSWDDPKDSFHHNGIMVFDTNAGSGFTGIVIRGNYIHGDFGKNVTAWIFIDDNAKDITGTLFYNNVLVNGGSLHGPANLYITDSGSASTFYNNVIFGNGFGSGLGATANATIKNNVISSVAQFIAVKSPIVAIDHNQYMNGVPSGCDKWLYGGGPCSGQKTMAAWQAACSCDGSPSAYDSANSVNPDGSPQAGSPAIGAGANLTSLNIPALDFDKRGIARPSTGAWNAGAYQFSGTSSSAFPAKPTGLRWR